MALFTGHITVYAVDLTELDSKVRLLQKTFADSKCETWLGNKRFDMFDGVTFHAQTLHLPTVTDLEKDG